MTAAHERGERDGSVRSCASGAPRTGIGLGAPALEIWGVLNVTPDSFSDGGAFFSAESALAHAVRMLAEGATVIDVGGASSRPRGAIYGEGAAAVAPDEERRRVEPVVGALVARGVRVSIDTTSPEVAAAALTAGARIVNDVSMGASERLLEVCAAHEAELVLMHTRGDGRVDATTTAYEDVVEETLCELLGAVERAVSRGVARERIWIDPGLGFAKTAAQSMTLLGATRRFVEVGLPVLVGASRKSFLAAMATEPDGARPAPMDRLGASLAAVCVAAWAGARAVRVHDVRASRQAARIAELAAAATHAGETKAGAPGTRATEVDR
jgi:dihydropteroate synthase